MFLEEFDEEAYYRALKKEGWEDGRIEGLAEGKAEDILDLLADLGEVPENLKEEIMGQKDFDILSRWLKAAARSGSIEEFVGRM